MRGHLNLTLINDLPLTCVFASFLLRLTVDMKGFLSEKKYGFLETTLFVYIYLSAAFSSFVNYLLVFRKFWKQKIEGKDFQPWQ